jgi:[ribosomal protein S5]-alanine N-acetyltransferase
MNSFRFKPFPSLSSLNLNFRQLSRADAEDILILRSSDEVNQYLDRPRASSIEEALEFIGKINLGISQNECILWAITQKSFDQFMGSICIWNISADGSNAEIGYEMLPRFQGMGVMQEAIPIIIRYAFDAMKIKTLLAESSPLNIKSVKLLEKNGFCQVPAPASHSCDVSQSETLAFYALANKDL